SCSCPREQARDGITNGVVGKASAEFIRGKRCFGNALLERKETKMSDLATTTKKRPVQIDLSSDLITEIERLAAEETLTRTAWMRRLLHGAVKAATKQREG